MKQKYIVQRASPITQRVNSMELEYDIADYEAWEVGMVIQEAMPYLRPDEREFLMTGLLPHEWDEIFQDQVCIDKPEN